MKYDIYISYSSKDSVFVNDLCSALERAKLSYFLGYKSDLDTPQEYFDRVSDIIAESKAVLFIASDHSIADGWCKGELSCVANHGVRIYSYYISEAEPLAVPSKTFSANTTSVDELLSYISLYVETAKKQEVVVKPAPEPTRIVEISWRWALATIVLVLIGLTATAIIVNWPTDEPKPIKRSQNVAKKSNEHTQKVKSANFEKPHSYVEYTNGLNMKMVNVKGGTFLMGSETGGYHERPVHSVTLGSYYIAETEVTQAQWRVVMGTNPSNFKGDNRPVECVSWDDAMEFCKKLSELTGKNYSLPTEAQWEYAARGGNKRRGYTYSGSNNIDDVAKYCLAGGTNIVKSKKPNELGLYDMSGNVYEWCLDKYSDSYYSSSPPTNPTGPSSGNHRVLRGGSWNELAIYCRVAYRNNSDSSNSNCYCGFRVVCL